MQNLADNLEWEGSDSRYWGETITSYVSEHPETIVTGEEGELTYSFGDVIGEEWEKLCLDIFKEFYGEDDRYDDDGTPLIWCYVKPKNNVISNMNQTFNMDGDISGMIACCFNYNEVAT